MCVCVCVCVCACVRACVRVWVCALHMTSQHTVTRAHMFVHHDAEIINTTSGEPLCVLTKNLDDHLSQASYNTS